MLCYTLIIYLHLILGQMGMGKLVHRLRNLMTVQQI